MQEDLSGPHSSPRSLGAMDAFDGYVAYRMLDPSGAVLGREIQEMQDLMMKSVPSMRIDQDLGLGK